MLATPERQVPPESTLTPEALPQEALPQEAPQSHSKRFRSPQHVHVVYEDSKKNPLNLWTEDDVENWLERTAGGGKQIAKAAKAAGVDGRILQELDSAAWIELGVTVALRRSKLAAAVKQAAEGKKPFVDTPAAVDSPAVEQQPSSGSGVSSSFNLAGPAEDDAHKIECRCAIQNLNIHNFAESQTFEAFVKFEAAWEDPSPILKTIKDAGFNLDDRIVKSKCTYGKLVLLKPDGSESSGLFAPRIMFKNRVREPKSKEEWYSLSKWSEEKPTVRWYCHFTGVFNMREASLRKFPLDEQMLTIEVQTGWPLSKGDKLRGSGRGSGRGTPTSPGTPGGSSSRSGTPNRRSLPAQPLRASTEKLSEEPHWKRNGVELKKSKLPSVVSVGSQSFAMKNE